MNEVAEELAKQERVVYWSSDQAPSVNQTHPHTTVECSACGEDPGSVVTPSLIPPRTPASSTEVNFD